MEEVAQFCFPIYCLASYCQCGAIVSLRKYLTKKKRKKRKKRKHRHIFLKYKNNNSIARWLNKAAFGLVTTTFQLFIAHKLRTVHQIVSLGVQGQKMEIVQNQKAPLFVGSQTQQNQHYVTQSEHLDQSMEYKWGENTLQANGRTKQMITLLIEFFFLVLSALKQIFSKWRK